MVSETHPFASQLGAAFERLPAPLRDFHMTTRSRIFSGRASIEHGQGTFTKTVIALAGFPPAAQDVPLTIEISKNERKEKWVRSFGRHKTRSAITVDGVTGKITEVFGPFSCTLKLEVKNATLHIATPSAKFLGLPLPSALSPQSRSVEFSDGPNRLCFDIKAFWPNNVVIIRYAGFLLVPSEDTL